MQRSLGSAAAVVLVAAVAYRVAASQFRPAAAAAAGAGAGAAALALVAGVLRRRRSNTRNLTHEHILVIGASSGVGKELAVRYARSGRSVSLHLVARRPLDHDMFGGNSTGEQRHVDIAFTQTDMTKPEDVVRLAEEVAKRWDRVDTIIVCAGALTVQPVLCVTGQTQPDAPSIVVASQNASAAALDRLASLATASYNANVLPSLLLVPAFLQLLLASPAPRLAVLSSVAAEIPAPTRAIYAAHKAALSMLLRSMRIELESLVVSAAPEEKRRIGITLVHPASIDTGLRSSALDAPATAHASTSERKAMSASYVAEQVDEAIRNQEDEVWLPKSYWWISKLAMVLLPDVVKNGAKRKYGFA